MLLPNRADAIRAPLYDRRRETGGEGGGRSELTLVFKVADGGFRIQGVY